MADAASAIAANVSTTAMTTSTTALEDTRAA
jgi:hypothetical protein